VHFQHVEADGSAGQPGIDRPRVIGEPGPASVALAIERDEIESDLFRWTRVRRRALEHARWPASALDARHRGIDLVERAHPRRQQHRVAGVEHAIEQRRVRRLARRNLPHRLSDAFEQIDGFDRKRRRDEQDVALAAVLGQAAPLLFGELHARPVVVARGVLAAELHPKRLRRRALRGSDVGLELDSVGAGGGNRIDEGVRQAKAAVVRQRHFANQQASAAAEAAQCGVGRAHACRYFWGFQ
jgi:hypothetical protein